MEKKPDLIVRLFAGDTLVDQSTDANLWQRVLSEIRGLAPAPSASTKQFEPEPEADTDASPAIRAFAKSVGMTAEEIVGGLDPSSETPFVHLSHHEWEALKRNTPVKGPGAIPPSVLAATALVIWQKHGHTPDVTPQMVRAVIGTIDLEDPNAARAIGNCEWLQNRGGRISLNPSRASAATRLLRAYCRREALGEPG
jgi:hypothetical protein